MNILMIYPRYPITFWSFKYILKYIAKKGVPVRSATGVISTHFLTNQNLK